MRLEYFILTIQRYNALFACFLDVFWQHYHFIFFINFVVVRTNSTFGSSKLYTYNLFSVCNLTTFTHFSDISYRRNGWSRLSDTRKALLQDPTFLSAALIYGKTASSISYRWRYRRFPKIRYAVPRISLHTLEISQLFYSVHRSINILWHRGNMAKF